MDLGLEVAVVRGRTVLTVSGEVDVANAAELQAKLAEVLDALEAGSGAPTPADAGTGAQAAEPDVSVDSVAGTDLDASTAGRAAERDVIVDLSGVTFIDSTGLGVLVAGRNRVAELSGSISIVCTLERVLKLLRITGLDAVFAVYPTVDACIDAAAPGIRGEANGSPAAAPAKTNLPQA